MTIRGCSSFVTPFAANLFNLCGHDIENLVGVELGVPCAQCIDQRPWRAPQALEEGEICRTHNDGVELAILFNQYRLTCLTHAGK